MPPDWAEPPARTRVWPPLTLVLLGVFAGLVVTLFSLAHMDRVVALPRCDTRAAPAVLCGTLAEGYPLRWLTVVHGAPSLDSAATAGDWVQYAVISTSVLYGLWLGTWARDRDAGPRFPAGAATAVFGAGLCGLTITVLTGGLPWTWLTASHDEPRISGWWLLADVTSLTLACRCVCLAVRVGARRVRGAYQER